VRETASTHPCVYGDAQAHDTVVLFGDSHAFQWLPAVEFVANANHWRLVVFAKVSCSFVDLHIWSEHLRRPYRECETWRRESLQQIEALRPTLTIMASANSYVALDAHPDALHVSLAEWQQAAHRSVSRLAKAGLAQVVLVDSPAASVDVPACLAGGPLARLVKSDCSFARADAIRTDTRRALASALHGLSRARLIDMNDLICPDVRCPVVRDGMVLYSDRNHLTKAFTASLGPALRTRIGTLTDENVAVRSPEGLDSK
jgi:hypothetical protein